MPRVLRVVCAIAFMGLTASVKGQVLLGSITGLITDPGGAVLPGVTVTLTSPALQVNQIVRVSGPDGEYRLADLPPGTYQVRYQLAGFGTVVRDDLRITSGFNARVNVTLPLATVEQDITVRAQSPLVDVVSTRGGTTVAKEVLTSTPNTGTMQDLFVISGGVRSNYAPLNGARGVQSILTVTTTYTYGQILSYLVAQSLDGVITYPNQLPDLNSSEEIEVRTFGNSAEVGAPGQATVFVLKSGGDEFHGRVTEAYQNNAWQSGNIDARLLSQGIKVNQIKYLNDAFFDLGGYIRPRRVWFYAAYRDQRNETLPPGFVQGPGHDVPASDIVKEPVPTVKMSYQAAQNHKFVGLFTQNTVIESAYAETPYPFTPFESTIDYHQPFPTAKGEWQGTFGGRVFVSAIGAMHSIGAYRYPQPCCAAQISTYDLVTQQRAGSVWSALRGWRKSTRYQQSAKANYYAGHGNEITAGYSLLPSTFRIVQPLEPSGDYLLVFNNNVPAQFWTRNTPVDGLAYQNDYAWYTSDVWRVSRRLTLNMGLRVDHQTADIPAQVKQPGPWPFARTGQLPPVDVFHATGPAPRVGASFDVSGDGRTAVKATYGRYNHPHIYGWVGQFNPNYSAMTMYRWTDPTGCRCYVPGTINLDPNGPDVLGVSGATNAIVNPDLTFTRTHEVTTSVERELAGRMSVRALYVYKREAGTEANINTLRPYGVWDRMLTAQVPGPDGKLSDATGSLTFYDYDQAYRGSRYVASTIVNGWDRPSSFHNLELSLRHRESGHWFGDTTLLLTKNHRWLKSFVETPNDLLFPIDNTWTWQYRLTGGYRFPKDMRVSTLMQVDNGFKGQRTVQFSAPTSGLISLPVEPFGATVGPTRTIVNLRATKELVISRSRVGVYADVFNVFNTNADWAQNLVSGPTFGYTTALPDPRVLRIGASFQF
jgi:hypothetical protein